MVIRLVGWLKRVILSLSLSLSLGISVAAVNMAGDTLLRECGEDAPQALLALSQPRITGTGSSRVFSNPWPEWQVRVRIKAVMHTPVGADQRCLPLIAGSNVRKLCKVHLGTSIPQQCHWTPSGSPKPHSRRSCTSIPPCTP